MDVIKLNKKLWLKVAPPIFSAKERSLASASEAKERGRLLADLWSTDGREEVGQATRRHKDN